MIATASDPPAGRKRDSGEGTMGVVSSISTPAGKGYRSRSSTHRRKDDGGGLKHLDVGREKIWLQDLHPLSRKRIVPSFNGRWGRPQHRSTLMAGPPQQPCWRGMGLRRLTS